LRYKYKQYNRFISSLILWGGLLGFWGLGPGGSGNYLRAKSVKFVKAIHFQKAAKKSVTNFLLGKKRSKGGINPVSLCRIAPGRLCITDSVNGTVIILSDSGKTLKRITRVKGIKLLSPVAACVDDRGHLYVSDSALQAVLEFGPKYKFKKVFLGQSGVRITGIVFSRGRFFCLDTPNHRLLCFDSKGEFKFQVGQRGTAPAEFNYPTHITADNDYIYINDAMNFRVQVMDHDGRFVRAFGTFGRGGGNFSKPKGIAVDHKKRIFVTDAMFDNVQIFDMNGKFLYYFGGRGHGSGEFWMPSGIMSGPDNIIWVADTYNNRLQLFHLQEDTP
jgi:sugar lactone lactonase YvrE